MLSMQDSKNPATIYGYCCVALGATLQGAGPTCQFDGDVYEWQCSDTPVDLFTASAGSPEGADTCQEPPHQPPAHCSLPVLAHWQQGAVGRQWQQAVVAFFTLLQCRLLAYVDAAGRWQGSSPAARVAPVGTNSVQAVMVRGGGRTPGLLAGLLVGCAWASLVRVTLADAQRSIVASRHPCCSSCVPGPGTSKLLAYAGPSAGTAREPHLGSLATRPSRRDSHAIRPGSLWAGGSVTAGPQRRRRAGRASSKLW